MTQSRDRKIILVTRKTRLENLIMRYNTMEQAKFVIEHSGSDFSDYIKEDATYKQVVSSIISTLEVFGYVQVVDREYIPTFIFSKNSIVVAVGQDGLVANVLKYLDTQPLIGVNPDPLRYDGVLLPFRVKDLTAVMKDLLSGNAGFKEVTLAKASLNDGQTLLGVNDIFIGQRTHTSAQYIVESGDKKEIQSSSGIIISTGLGSTGWLKSILAGASVIASVCLEASLELRKRKEIRWNSDYLYYTVREPYPSKWTSAEMVFGEINKGTSFKVQSLMPDNGVIFSDGIENDYLQFNSGSEVVITIDDHKGMLVV